MADKIIHYVDTSDQPYVHILCLNREGFVSCIEEHEHGEEIHCCSIPTYIAEYDSYDYDMQQQTLYTFDFAKVTCEKCIEKEFDNLKAAEQPLPRPPKEK